MIRLKNEKQIDGIRKSCKLLAHMFEEIIPKVEPGMSTKDIDDLAVKFIKSNGGKPAWYTVDFPGALCISVNNEVMKTKCASGTTGKFTNVPEYIVTLEISLKMKTSLEALGAKVVMIREDHNVNISNKERAEIGNNANADVVLRVHCNGAESESAKGIELYVRDKGDNTAAYKERSDYDYSVASELMDYLISATGAKNRGVKRSDNYTGTNWSSVPSVIIECGFMSNEEEDNLLVTEAYQQKFADAVAEWLKNSEIIKK